MNITVLLFAKYREIVGHSTMSLELPVPATVADLRALLQEKYPEMEHLLNTSAIAVNQDYANDTHPLKPGDEVALIPPVSGGSVLGSGGELS